MAKIIVLKGTGSVQADRVSLNKNFESINTDLATLFDDLANIELTPGPTGPAGQSINIESGSKGATESGSSGDFSYDSSYLYICVDEDTWVRVAVETTW